MLKSIPKELIFALENWYKPAGIAITNPAQREAESGDYGACRLGLNGQNVAFRIGKVTPNRPGNFVTLWKRIKGTIVPLDFSDDIDFVVVSVTDGIQSGQFVFDQHILRDKGIISYHGKKGKLSFRIFPPWTSPAKTALKTQEWQLRYFLFIPQKGNADLAQVLKLFKVSY
jgi:hypothetical protein